MKVIELLNKISEKQFPKIIIYRDYTFLWNPYKEDYVCKEKDEYNDEIWFSDFSADGLIKWLSEEITIL